MIVKNNKQQILQEVDRLIGVKLEKAASLVEKSAKDNCRPHWTKLKPSIKRIVERRKAFVGTNLEHGPYIEAGIRPHVIEPKKAQALHFFVGGDEVFTKRVQHPGFAPIPFLRPALESNVNEIRKIFGVS